MKKITYLVGGIVVVAVLALAGFFYLRPAVANYYAKGAINIFLDNKSDRYEQALEYIETAKWWGRDDTNLGILKGQLLSAVGRYDEAKAQYELVKAKDISSIAAVDELLKELP